MPSRFQAILIDLFWTAVDMDFANYPRLHASFQERTPDTISDADLLFEEAKIYGLNTTREDFVCAYFESRQKITEGWEKGDTEETTSEDKFLQLLQALGFSSEELAARLTALHMQHIVEATRIPDKRRDFLQQVSSQYRIALVSNFDHAPSGYRILARHGIEKYFHGIVISDEIGKRKPHRLLFETAMERIGVRPEESLMVGDSPLADIQGAKELGIATAWVRRPGEMWPQDLDPPDHTVSDLSELDTILRRK